MTNPNPQLPPPASPARAPSSAAWMVFLIPLLLGLAWLGTYYVAAEQVPAMNELGVWNFAIGLFLVAVGVAGAVIIRAAGRHVPAAPAGPFNPRTNSLSIVALVLGLVLPLAAIPVGHLARSQIRVTGEQGDGLALAGLVLGYLSLAFAVLAVAVIVVAAL
ncbi:cell division protein CrgA [Nocardia sp. NPDC003693]